MLRKEFSMLGGVLAALCAAHAGHAASAAADEQALDAVRTMAPRVYAVARGVEQARTREDVTLDAQVRELRAGVEAIRKQAHVASADTSTPLARKLRAMSLLIGNIERARTHATPDVPTLIPAHRPVEQRATFAKLDQHGGRCESALGLAVGFEWNGTLARGAQIWVRVADARVEAIRLDTYAVPMDTEIAAFDACPQGNEAPAYVSDDTFGLAAALIAHPSTAGAPVWLRVRNLGDRGELSLAAAAASSIRGHVTDAASGVPMDSNLYALNSAGDYVANGYSNGADGYEIPLDPGHYYLTASTNDHVDEIWPDIECPNGNFSDCPWHSAQLIAVTAGSATSGIDFALGSGARLIGRVRDASSGLALVNASVEIQDARGYGVGSGYTDASGRYAITTLSAGTYYLRANADTYYHQLFNGIDCGLWPDPCEASAGTPIALARGQTFDHADFSLHRAAYANVTVNMPPGSSAYYATVYAYGATGQIAASTGVAPGQPSLLGPLPIGSYHFAANAPTQVSQLFDHVDCATDCAGQLASGTLVNVTGQQPDPIVVFDLRSMAKVRGRITDANSGDPLLNVGVQLWSTTQPGSGNFGGGTQADGTYVIEGVAPGSYWVVARSQDHHDAAYANAPCTDNQYNGISGCQLTSAQTITVGATDVSGIDFALPLNAAITGTLRYQSAHPPLLPAYANVDAYTITGSRLRSASSSSDGTYRIEDLPPGTYFFEAGNYDAYSQIYTGIDCPLLGQSCDPTVGTAVVLTQGQTHAGVDFDLIFSRRIVGRVTDSTTGTAIAGVVIDSWDPQSGAHCDDVATDNDGYYVLDSTGYCSATARKLSTDAGLSYIDEVYDDVACPNGSAYAGHCSLSAGATVSLPTSQPVLARADFALTARDPDAIFHNGFDAPAPRASTR
jgi:protocatechuate 3,4-dioxygenase beta subunit